jgi:hypothetical protein
MPGNRKKAEETLYADLRRIISGNADVVIDLYKNKFAQMTDEEFEKFATDVKEQREFLRIVVPNMSEVSLNAANLFRAADHFGYSLMHRIVVPGEGDMPPYLSEKEQFVGLAVVRRAAQHLDKKISVPADANTVDIISGQPTGRSKGSKISAPELGVLQALGADKMITETISVRGGDQGSFLAMNASLQRTGGFSLERVKQASTGVQSARTVGTYLRGMHLENTLTKK